MLNLPKNIYLISLVMSLSFTSISLMILISSLLGHQIAPHPDLATLPMAAMVIGTAISTIPAAMIMQRLGRKRGLGCGIIVAILGSILAFFAAKTANFPLFIGAALCFGFNIAFIQQGRFVIIENATNVKQQADGLTLALLASLIAGVIGPQLGTVGKDITTSPYAGSFLLLTIVLCLSLVTLLFYQNLAVAPEEKIQSQRSIGEIVRQPIFILVAGSAAIAYGVMSLIMTATPLSMHELSGHSLEQTKLVIQSHVIAMFLPSIITGQLIKKGFRFSVIVSGLVLYLVVCIIAFNGAQVMHYWWALVLLGLGWNLLFITSTTLLPKAYSTQEKFKAQATNDFLIFTFQAIATFSAGWLLFNLHWLGVISIGFGLTIIWLCCFGLLARINMS